jgi:hypothetical protein
VKKLIVAVVTALILALLIPASAFAFTDVGAEHPYAEAIGFLSDAGIISGYADGSFRPEEQVWRQHFAKMIVLALDVPVSEASISTFTDLDPSGADSLYPDNYIAAAAQAGLTNGTAPNTFGPYLSITRAQLLTMCVRAAQNYAGHTLDEPNADYWNWGMLASFEDDTHGSNVHMAEYNGLLYGIQLDEEDYWDPWQPATRGEVANILYNLMIILGL